MCFSCEWCEEIKNRPLVAGDMIGALDIRRIIKVGMATS